MSALTQHSSLRAVLVFVRVEEVDFRSPHDHSGQSHVKGHCHLCMKNKAATLYNARGAVHLVLIRRPGSSITWYIERVGQSDLGS